MTHADVVPCGVSAPADHVGDVMAELFRIGGQIQDMQHRDSRTLLKVGIPHDNVLFEKWLAKAFHGTATSTLPMNCEPESWME
jgi:translation elongation factor EF-G